MTEASWRILICLGEKREVSALNIGVWRKKKDGWIDRWRDEYSYTDGCSLRVRERLLHREKERRMYR